MSSFLALIPLVSLVLLQAPVPRNSDIENIGHRDINRGSLSISRDREIELGRQTRIDLERNVKLYQQPEVTAYVNSIVQLLAANSDATIPIVSGIIDSDEIDTIALPGGTVYVTTGLIRSADNEAELAAALAHPIAHVAARHAAEMAMKMELINQASVPLLSGRPNMHFTQFARKNVTEADFLGLQYLYKAGWDPEAAIAFLVKMQARAATAGDPSSPLPEDEIQGRYLGNIKLAAASRFETHPPISMRLDNLRHQRDTLPARADNRLNTDAFNRAKSIVSSN
jgi:predicted Zn-dependent protease